jgi:GT2 family glycosyltransferase
MSDRVSIITVNFNQAEVTYALLDSIRRQDYANTEVIVVDNGSRDNPGPTLAARYPEVRFIRSEQNLGFAGGNNLGIAAATGAFLFFVNNDAELTAGCIGTLLARLYAPRTPAIGAISPLICYYRDEGGPSYDIIQYAGMTPVNPVTARNRTIGQGEPDRGQYTEAGPTAYAHGAAMMVSRAALIKAGPMPADFFLYYEELDWCERIRRAGFDIWLEPQARVYHKESLTVAKMGALKTYFLNRNRIRFVRRNYPARWPLFCVFLWLVAVPKNLLTLALRREWANLRAFRLAVQWNFWPRTNEFEKMTMP